MEISEQLKYVKDCLKKDAVEAISRSGSVPGYMGLNIEDMNNEDLINLINIMHDKFMYHKREADRLTVKLHQ